MAATEGLTIRILQLNVRAVGISVSYLAIHVTKQTFCIDIDEVLKYL